MLNRGKMTAGPPDLLLRPKKPALAARDLCLFSGR
jgi:hypothetical protein